MGRVARVATGDGEGKYRNMGDEDTTAAAADNTNPD